MRKARELADRHDALLVFDEIQCGVGRPGTYFAYQLFDPVVMPDIMIAAKPMACGIPLGVIAANEKSASTIKPGMHGSTYGGGPLACRVALEFFDILDTLLPSINTVGNYFRSRLADLMRRFGFIKEIRGQGLMIGVELTFPGKQLVLDGLESGLLFNCTHDTVLRFLPPYILSERDVDRAIKILTKLFKKVKPTETLMPAAGDLSVVIDEMTKADWPAIRAIYLEGIATGNATFETSAPDWSEWDGQPSPVLQARGTLSFRSFGMGGSQSGFKTARVRRSR